MSWRRGSAPITNTGAKGGLMRKNRKTRSHIVPKSRGGKDDKRNCVYIRDDLHRKYHELFGTMTPDEVINYLVSHFWNKQDYWVKMAISENARQA